MITVSIFRSMLSTSDDTRETQRIRESITIKDLYPDVDFEDSLISVNGFRQDENYLLEDGDVCTIRLFPKGDNAGAIWGAILGAIVGAAMFVIGFFTAGSTWILGVTLIAGGGLIGAVAGETIQHGSLARWFGANTSAKDSKQLEQIPQLRGAKNQSNFNKPIPLVLGKHFFTPMYVGNPYTLIGGEDGEDQYFYALYMLGYGKLKVTDIKLGEIGDIASNHKNGYKDDGLMTIDNGFIDGDPFILKGEPTIDLIQTNRESDAIYPQAVFEERLNIELKNVAPVDGKDTDPLEVVRFSARNPQKIQVEITFPSGLVEYNDKGDKINKSVNICLGYRISTPNDTNRWEPFGYFEPGNPHNSTLGDNTGNLAFNTITRNKYKVMRFVAEKTFTSYSQVSDIYDTRVIELKIFREDDQSDDTRVIDKVYLTAIRTWMFDNEKSKAGILVPQVPVVRELRDKTSRLAFKIKATDNTQGMLDALNCIVESKCRIWDGEKWSDPDWDIKKQQWTGNSEVPTSNPASLALKLLQSPTLGRKGYLESMLDMNSFGEFYEWCEEKKYTCNGVLTTEKRLDDTLALILSTGRAMRTLNGNKYGLLIDKPREYPVMILNSQNVLEASNQKIFADIPDGFLIKFINEADGYLETEVYVMRNGSNDPESIPGSVIESIEIPFVTNYDQIVKIGWYLLACAHLRPEVWNRKLSYDGYLIAIGDLVEVQDDTILVGIGEGGVITGLISDGERITEIQTDGQFEVIDPSLSYGIKIMQYDGYNQPKARAIQVQITKAGIYNNFQVNISLNNIPIPTKGDIVSFGLYDRITTSALCFGKKDNGDGTFDVVLVPYQEGIYTTDLGEIPPYEANITPPQSLPPLNQIPPPSVTLPDMIDVFDGITSGRDAQMIELAPSVQMIIRGSDGSLEPNTISCSQVIIVGNDPPVTPNPLRMLQYHTSKNDGTYFLYTNPIEVGDWDWIEFLLSDNGIELDRQRVPVLREGSDAVYLDIENQNYPLFCTYDGVPKENQLPFSVQARLFRGIELAKDVTWELRNAPRGITINSNGLISVNPEFKYTEEIVNYPATGNNIVDPLSLPFYPFSGKWMTGRLELGALTEIGVRAYYQGKVFTRNLRIRKVLDGSPGKKGEQGDPAPDYRGRVTNRGDQYQNGRVTINGHLVQLHYGDTILYLGTTLDSVWENAMLIRWTESGWEKLDPDSDVNSSDYMLALNDMFDGAPNARFNISFIKRLFSQKLNAEVANILFKLIVGSGTNGIEIDGTKSWIKSNNYESGISGFILNKQKDANGIQAEFIDIKTVNLNAVNGVVEGTLKVGDAWNIDGSENNTQALGSLLALKSRNNNSLMLKSPKLFGEIYIMGGGALNLIGNMEVGSNSLVSSKATKKIEGNYTPSALYNFLNNLGIGINVLCIASGSFVTPSIQPVDSQLFHVSCINNQVGVITLRGFSNNMIRYSAGVYQDRIVINNTAGGNIINISGNTTINIQVMLI